MEYARELLDYQFQKALTAREEGYHVDKSLKLYNLKLRYQGFRTYNPVLLVLGILLELPLDLMVGVFDGVRNGLRDWWSGAREVGRYLAARYRRD